MSNVLGLIAGGGRLPFLVAAGARQAGLSVVCVGFADIVEPALAEHVDVFYPVSVARPTSWIRKLRRHGASRAIMVGGVAKSRLLTPWLIVKYRPDWRTLRFYYWRLRGKDRQTDSLLSALADELASGGVYLENSIMYCKDHLATKGILTSHRPGCQADIDFGWKIAKRLGDLDIGQAVAVKDRQVIAVEAIEGTAEMINRTGQLCRSKGWTLVKTSKPNQDMRFDVPCVGPDTIRGLAEHGGQCLVVEAGKTIIIDKPQTIDLANRLGIAVVAMEADPVDGCLPQEAKPA